MVQYVNTSLFLVLWVFFGEKRVVFMAVIGAMAKGRLDDRGYFA